MISTDTNLDFNNVLVNVEITKALEIFSLLVHVNQCSQLMLIKQLY